MKRQDLKEFLAGRKQLTEMGFNSPGASANSGLPPMWTGRQEKLAAAWQDIMVQMEALFLDVLDESQDIYSQCLPLLKDIRSSRGEACHENLPRFNALVQILAQYVNQSPTMALCVSRMQHLMQELQYVCEELAPRDPRVPEAPPRRKDDWTAKTMGQKKPDMTFVHSGGVDDRWESTLKKEIKGGTVSDNKNPAHLPSCPSLVMASLGSAADSISESIGDLEANFLRAGDAIRLCLEMYTDVDRAEISISGAAPGSFPRLEVKCFWEGSAYSGQADLFWSENGKDRVLVIEGKSDGKISMGENLADSEVASRIYECLNTVFMSDPRMGRAHVVPSIYRLLGKVQRGESIQPANISEILEGLTTYIGLHESVRLMPEKIKLQCESFSDLLWLFFYEWEYDHQKNGDPSTNPLAENALVGAWRSPRIMVNLESAEVYLSDGESEPELLPASAKDEDVTAKLLSMSFQKEDVSRGRVIEGEDPTLEEEWEGPFRGELTEGSDKERWYFKCAQCKKPWAVEYSRMNVERPAPTYLHGHLVKGPSVPSVPPARQSELDKECSSPCPKCGYNPEGGKKHQTMGKVTTTGLQGSAMAPPCDGRCTNAPGPSCDCQCGGENHGSGKLVPKAVNRGAVKESWEGFFKDALTEQGDWDPREHPRHLHTGEFVDKGSATSHQKKAAKQAHKARTVGKTPKGPIPTTREEIKPSRSKYDPQTEKPAQEAPPPKAEEPQAPAPEQNQEPQAPPQEPYLPAPVEQPIAPAESPAPQVQQVPVPVPFGAMLPPPPAYAQLPPPPGKGKELPQDQSYQPTGEAPNLPPPPVSKIPKGEKNAMSPNTRTDRASVSTHPNSPDDPKEEPLRPPVPAAPVMKRDNPDLDAAFGFGPPDQGPPQNVPDQAQNPAQGTPKSPEAPQNKVPVPDRGQDPDVDAVTQETGATDANTDEDVQSLLKLLMGRQQQPQQAPAGGEQPQGDELPDTEDFLNQRKEELSTVGGKLSRKIYAQDLIKARAAVDGLPQDQKPATPADRQRLIREKAQEFQKQREEFWKNAMKNVDSFLNAVSSLSEITWDNVMDVAARLSSQKSGENYFNA